MSGEQPKVDALEGSTLSRMPCCRPSSARHLREI